MTYLPTAETMRNYADFLEKPKYEVRPDGQKFLLPNGEPTKAAIVALRFCAALADLRERQQPLGEPFQSILYEDLWSLYAR